jgi:transposase
MKKEIENQKSYIGIDVSKLTIDVCIITAQGEQDYQQFENTSKDFKKHGVMVK